MVRRIETSIDPFDWDVFQPHLAANLHGLIRRTYNLYGAVSVYSTTVQAIATTSSRAAFQQVQPGYWYIVKQLYTVHYNTGIIYYICYTTQLYTVHYNTGIIYYICHITQLGGVHVLIFIGRWSCL